MARLFTSGFEDTLANEGWSTSGTPTLVTAPVNSGGFSCQINALSETIFRPVGFDTSESSFYTRCYANINVLPASASTRLIQISLSTGAELWRCVLTSTGTLQAQTSGAVNIGSASTALSLDTWYVIETRTLRRAAGNDEIEARCYLATVSPATSFVNDLGTDRGWGGGAGRLGISANDVAATFYVDDVAINDSTGASDTGWPGPLIAPVMPRSFQPIPFM